MTQGTALLKASDEAKKALLDKILIYEENLEYLQERIQSGGNLISKSNKSVEKYQNEGKELREKIKLKSEIIRKQVNHDFILFFIFYRFLFYPSHSFLLLNVDHFGLLHSNKQHTIPKFQNFTQPPFDYLYLIAYICLFPCFRRRLLRI